MKGRLRLHFTLGLTILSSSKTTGYLGKLVVYLITDSRPLTVASSLDWWSSATLNVPCGPRTC